MALLSISRAWVLVSRTVNRLKYHEMSKNCEANPVATFWTAVEMLKWLGEEKAGDALLEVVENVCERGIMTKDLGGNATTVEVTNAVCDEIQRKFGGKSSG
jgi:isocitrate/isopropylmalate dehydrogenase